MKKIDVTGEDDRSIDREFLDAVEIKDYKIEIKDAWPVIVSFKEA